MATAQEGIVNVSPTESKDPNVMSDPEARTLEDRGLDARRPDRTPKEIHEDITERRKRLGAFMDELEHQLSPSSIVAEVKGYLSANRHRIIHQVTNGSEKMMSSAKETSSRVVKSNPTALGLIGLGIGWLLVGDKVKDKTRTVSAEHPDTADQVNRARETVKSRVENVKTGSREAYDTGVAKIREVTNTYPVSLGLLTLASGVLVGLALPVSRREREYLKEAGRDLKRRAEEKGEEFVDRGHEMIDRGQERTVEAMNRMQKNTSSEHGRTGTGESESSQGSSSYGTSGQSQPFSR